ncbi:MAG: hypothetical protein AAF288_09930 [Planctomycetota bacterium]
MGTDPTALRRCLVLTAPQGEPPTVLLEALDRRSAEVCQARDAPGAMVELAHGPAEVLVVVEPQHSTVVDELVDAVRRYHPQTALWRFGQQDGSPRLSEFDPPQRAHSVAQAPAPPVQNGPDPREALRDLLTPSPDTAADPFGEDGPAWISQEELAMLLGTEPASLKPPQNGQADPFGGRLAAEG